MDETTVERNVIAQAIQSIPVTVPWTFETAPASPQQVVTYYLEKVENCDIFILIINKSISKAVELEAETARIYNKPILIFVKKNQLVNPEVENFLKRANVTYKRFEPNELESIARQSVLEMIITSFRSKMSGSNRDKYKKKLETEHSNEIIRSSLFAHVIPMKRYSVKSPIELVKETVHSDAILPVMVEMAHKDSIPEKIEFAKTSQYAQKYVNSWAEKEVEIIGFKLLTDEIIKHVSCFDNLYDAGSASCGQYHALQSLKLNRQASVNDTIEYVAQDFNPDWRKLFDLQIGEFYDMPLPEIPNVSMEYSILSCTHVLHYFENHPIAIYTCLFSFNKLLKVGGVCYITAPEKESQPGMLDLLERAALDAGFAILTSGKQRLVQPIDKSSHSITTYLYLILRKENEFEINNRILNSERWKKLLGVSFFREKVRKQAKKFGVTKEGDIPEDIRELERDLNIIFNEKNYYLRTLRYALDVVNHTLGKHKTEQKIDNCIKDICTSMNRITISINSDNKKDLIENCGTYFYSLVSYYVITYNFPDLSRIHGIYNTVQSVLNSSKDIRVHMDDLTDEQIARLLRHLFELCNFESIDLRKAFDDYSESQYKPRLVGT